jgi:hypothetical protein
MGMTDTNDGMTTIEVKIFLTLIIPNLTTLSFYDIHIEQGIYVK